MEYNKKLGSFVVVSFIYVFIHLFHRRFEETLNTTVLKLKAKNENNLPLSTKRFPFGGKQPGK